MGVDLIKAPITANKKYSQPGLELKSFEQRLAARRVAGRSLVLV
jgi:hypothetical protein